MKGNILEGNTMICSLLKNKYILNNILIFTYMCCYIPHLLR